VLEKYGTACVICGYDVHVEAAHLAPKHELSDDRIENGVPLCPNHHWELDHDIVNTDQVRRARDAHQGSWG
jgi:predicted restriction endonuclease